MAALGYKPGPADGLWGPRTGSAYAAFLRDSGLPPGDVLTPDALRAMRAAAKARNVEAPAPVAASPTPEKEPEPAPLPADLHRLVAADDVDGLKAALAGGADPNARDGKGWTPLMLASDNGRTLLIPLLLKAGAEPDIRASDGATALFIAAVHGHSEIIAHLMKADADISIKGPKERTATDMARMKYGTKPAALQGEANPFVIGLIRGKRGNHVVTEQRLLATREFRDCDECPQMVKVPSGQFMMGAASDEKGAGSDEYPQHPVTIPWPFAISKFEVTFSQWDRCVAAGGCNGYRPDDEGWGRNRQPVINVDWRDVTSYVDWLTRKTGKTYRLLSEAEWEYAARAGTTGPFHFGSSISTDQANYNGTLSYASYGSALKGVHRKKTTAVGSFPANAFGLHDMHGNVSERVSDCHHETYHGAPSNGDAWTTGGDCDRRVVRGGSWSMVSDNLRSAARSPFKAGSRYNHIGFRVAQTLMP